MSKKEIFIRIKFIIEISVCFHSSFIDVLGLGYSERLMRVRRIPVAVEVSPIGIRPEPRDSRSTIIKMSEIFRFLSMVRIH